MNKIVKKDGYVFLVQDWDKKGFETYHNLGKDPDYWESKEPKGKKKKNIE